MKTYKIVRHHFRGKPYTIKRGLTLEQAQAHCEDPETSSRTCTKPNGLRLNRRHGQWFDGYTEEKS